MVSPHSIPPPITIDPAIEIVKRDDTHKHRRRFIGPMPERVVSELDTMTPKPANGWWHLFSRKESKRDEDAKVRASIREYALQFFLGHGGRTEDWDETEERHVREEMYRRWKQSDWAQARARREEAKTRQQWMGTSFDVGVFLGVDVLDAALSVHSPSTMGPGSAIGSRVLSAPSTAATNADTYFTAPLFSQEDLSSHDGVSTKRMAPSRISSLPFRGNIIRPDSMNSTTPLLGPPTTLIDGDHDMEAHSVIVGSPSSSRPMARTAKSAPGKYLDVPYPAKGKGKMVHYSDVPTPLEEPAPPREVLARSGAEVEDTSAGAAQHATEDIIPEPQDGDVIMRDRMLVQISCAASESLPANFDEHKARVTPHVQFYDLSEYIVAWRKNRLELYKNYSIPGKESMFRHKKLAFMIPLHSSTRLSLYSFTDFTFCLSCPFKPYRTRSHFKGRLLLHGGSKGTNIFVFNIKSRTRAADWYWRLWHHLDGELPPSIELRCVRLDTRVKIEIPSTELLDFHQAYKIFTPTNTVNLCKDVLSQIEDYEAVIGKALQNGSSLQLAWRVDARLDWVWQPDDVMGRYRDWAVLYGLSLRQAGKPAHLELRLTEHRPTRITLKDGTRLDEPPGIEGYLERIRPNSQLKQALYLSTHDGYIFFTPAAQAHPPPPPGPPTDTTDPDAIRGAEALRGARQIMGASGVCDLRAIVAVRRAFQVIPRHAEAVDVRGTPQWEDAPGFWESVEHYEEDMRDPGGAEGLARGDAASVRMRRSVELVLKSGRIVRFEAYSTQYALEWIARLRPLVSYWKKRHQVEARNEMDIVHVATGRSRITPHKHLDTERDEAPDAPPDPDGSSAELSSFYDWCLLQGCRPISKCGRLFGRKGMKGFYQHMQLVLVAGHLVEFHITGTSLHHRRRGVIHLLDAYVFSGYLAAQHLPEGQYHPDDPPLPRRYQDGLESDELDEDTLFMVWYYRTAAKIPENTVPPLDSKRKLAVYRTRSKLERDAWVWAIKSEIEKAVRGSREREALVRAAGGLVKT